MNKKWNLKSNDKVRAEEISKKYNLKRITAQILADKKISDDEIKIYLKPSRNDFYDPFLMPDMRMAVDRIIKAMREKEKILIYGDYDADGITSTTILKRFMNDRNIEVGTYIPNRLDEGYGLNEAAIQKIANDGYKLMITVDCGITAIKEVDIAKELGIDVIITDHHETGDEIPKAVGVIDCKRQDSKYPFNQLAGCGVAFKLTQALTKKLKLNENECLKYLDIACVGTISDIVPLIDENRVIAKLGLMLVKQTKNLGLQELLKVAGYKEINSGAISFGISPRINACGRMGHQEIALELLTTNDPIKARKLVEELEKYNKERQNIEKKIYSEAIELIKQDEQNLIKDGQNSTNDNKKNDIEKCIIVGKEGWHHGVIGIVSSKITEQYYKPSILICFEGEDAKGSGRSIQGFDLHEAISKCNQYLTNYGGHSMAIGLSLKLKDFEKFKKEFNEYANNNIDDKNLISTIQIDQTLESKDLTIDAIKELRMLEPFGDGNSEPIVMYKNLRINAIRTLSEGKHLKLFLQDENVKLDAIGFNLGMLVNDFQIGDKIDIIGNIQINSFNNDERFQIILKDIRKSIN